MTAHNPQSRLWPQSTLWPFTGHGGRLSAAQTRWPQVAKPWIDLSTGINPRAYPMASFPAPVLQRLPDESDVIKLTDAARYAYNVAPSDAIVPCAGSETALSVLPHLIAPGRDVAIMGWTYGGHEKAWKQAGHRTRVCENFADTSDADVVIAVNPNNPDGRIIAPADIRIFAERSPSKLVIIDEAFADVVPAASMLDRKALPPNVIVLRSIGKFYGLAGVRLGFAISNHPILPALADRLGDWPVSGPALHIGHAALSDSDWAIETRDWLSASAAQLDRCLIAAGFEISGGTSLFRLASHPDAASIFERLGAAGILTRPFANKPYIRFGLPADSDEFARLEEALRS